MYILYNNLPLSHNNISLNAKNSKVTTNGSNNNSAYTGSNFHIIFLYLLHIASRILSITIESYNMADNCTSRHIYYVVYFLCLDCVLCVP